jgi:hypothetical protein
MTQLIAWLRNSPGSSRGIPSEERQGSPISFFKKVASPKIWFFQRKLEVSKSFIHKLKIGLSLDF